MDFSTNVSYQMSFDQNFFVVRSVRILSKLVRSCQISEDELSVAASDNSAGYRNLQSQQMFIAVPRVSRFLLLPI